MNRVRRTMVATLQNGRHHHGTSFCTLLDPPGLGRLVNDRGIVTCCAPDAFGNVGDGDGVQKVYGRVLDVLPKCGQASAELVRASRRGMYLYRRNAQRSQDRADRDV